MKEQERRPFGVKGRRSSVAYMAGRCRFFVSYVVNSRNISPGGVGWRWVEMRLMVSISNSG